MTRAKKHVSWLFFFRLGSPLQEICLLFILFFDLTPFCGLFAAS